MMTYNDLKLAAEKNGIKYAYNHFKEPVEPPHLITRELRLNNFSADNVVYNSIIPVQMILTTDQRERNLEKKIEKNILKETYYEKEIAYISSERIYSVSYFFEIKEN